jgi:ribosomal subunit interface protein
MRINITGRHSTKVSDAVRERIDQRFDRTGSHYDQVTQMQITIDKDANIDTIEAVLHASGKELFAKASAENLYAAIDTLAEKIDRQLIKLRDKAISKKGSGVKREEMELDDNLEMSVS